MLTLYLLRHAKSSWTTQAQSDFDRPLNKRGRNDAVDLGRYLEKSGIHPKLVLLSSARRTCETHQLLAAQLTSPRDVITLKSLYGAGPAGILTEIKNLGRATTPLMVIGHNPGIEALVLHLTCDDPTGALDIINSKYPTSGMTILNFDIETWAQLAPNSGTLVDFTSPKNRRSI